MDTFTNRALVGSRRQRPTNKPIINQFLRAQQIIIGDTFVAVYTAALSLVLLPALLKILLPPYREVGFRSAHVQQHADDVALKFFKQSQTERPAADVRLF